MLIHQRIKKLEDKKIITGYKVDINVLAIQRDYYGIKINLSRYDEINKMMSEIYSLKETSAILYSIAGYDIEFDVEVKNTIQFHEIINSLRNKFSSIKEIKQIRAIKYYKLKHIPLIK
jgi:DNA-binding Lrp family transcriptional regulator